MENLSKNPSMDDWGVPGNHHPVALAQAEMALEPLTTLRTLRSSGCEPELKSLDGPNRNRWFAY